MVPVAQLAHLTHIIGTQRPDTGFTLNELHDHRGHRALGMLTDARLGEGVVHGVVITGLDELDGRHQRLVLLANRRLPGGGQRTERATVETMSQREDAGRLAADVRQCAMQCATVQFRQFQSRLVALGPGIAKVDMRAFRRAGELHEFGRQLDLRFRGKIVADMRDLAGLIGHGGDPCRMRVAKGVNRDAAKEVEVFVAVGIPQAGTLAVIHDAQWGAEHVHVDIAIFPEPLGVLGTELFSWCSHRNSSFPCRLQERPSCRCRQS